MGVGESKENRLIASEKSWLLILFATDFFLEDTKYLHQTFHENAGVMFPFCFFLFKLFLYSFSHWIATLYNTHFIDCEIEVQQGHLNCLK